MLELHSKLGVYSHPENCGEMRRDFSTWGLGNILSEGKEGAGRPPGGPSQKGSILCS